MICKVNQWPVFNNQLHHRDIPRLCAAAAAHLASGSFMDPWLAMEGHQELALGKVDGRGLADWTCNWQYDDAMVRVKLMDNGR